VNPCKIIVEIAIAECLITDNNYYADASRIQPYVLRLKCANERWKSTTWWELILPHWMAYVIGLRYITH